MACLQWPEHRRALGLTGLVSAAAIAAGTGEGLALALGGSGDVFSLFTITGFLALSAWLAATGVACLRAR